MKSDIIVIILTLLSRLGWPIKIFSVKLGWPIEFFSEGLVEQAGRMYPSPANKLWDYRISQAKLG